MRPHPAALLLALPAALAFTPQRSFRTPAGPAFFVQRFPSVSVESSAPVRSGSVTLAADPASFSNPEIAVTGLVFIVAVLGTTNFAASDDEPVAASPDTSAPAAGKEEAAPV